jgi:hypothetical protein
MNYSSTTGGAESLNGMSIRLADGLEFREVMDETSVNHAIKAYRHWLRIRRLLSLAQKSSVSPPS